MAPEDDPEHIIDRMEQLIEKASSERRETTPFDEGIDPIARKFRGAVRRGAEKNNDQ